MADYDANALALLLSKQFEKHMVDLYALKGEAAAGPSWLLPEIVVLERRSTQWLVDYALATKKFYTIGDKLQATAFLIEMNDVINVRLAIWRKWSNATGQPIPSSAKIDPIASFGAGITDFSGGVAKAAKIIVVLLLIGISVPVIKLFLTGSGK